MKKVILGFILISFLSRGADSPSIIFKENKGQWPDEVLFGAEVLNTKFYINKTGFNFCIFDLKEFSKPFNRKERNSVVHGHNYQVNIEGGNFSSYLMKDKLSEYYNYFIGKDRSKWADHVKASRSLEFNEVYNGIDLNVYSSGINLKYDLVVAPLADPNQIKLNYDFIDGITIRNGEVVVKTSVGEIIEKKPVVYQIINERKVTIECEYVLNGKSLSFKFPKGYDKNYELVIDPVVIVCSYSGTSVMSVANTCNYDVHGNIYTAGYANAGYQTTTGAFQVNNSQYADIFLSAFNSNGTSKLFSTYIGGDDFEMAIDIQVSKNDIILLGQTYSIDYPYTYTAFDTIQDGPNDLVVTRLDITGSNLMASTFMGGSSYEDLDQFSSEGQISSEMIVDAEKNIFITSNTISSDFPVTLGVLSPTMKGTSDGVVFKMDSSLNVIWSTYIGGSGKEDGLNIRTDGSGGLFIAGTTSSLDFPTTTGAYNMSSNSPTMSDMFVAHLNSTGTAFIAATYLGTTTDDEGAIMEIDASNNVYVSGRISSTIPGFLIPTSGTYSTASANTMFKLDPTLSTLGFKTLFGGVYPRPHFYCTAIKIDSCQNIYLAGWAWNGQVSTPDKFMPFQGNGTDMYMMVFGPNCSSLKFASYYGGNGTTPLGWGGMGEFSWGKSHFDDKGVLYLAVTSAENLPTTPGSYAPNFSDTVVSARIYNDAFLKIDFQTHVKANSSYGANIVGCPAPFTANFASTSNTGTTYWDFGDGNNSTQDTISHMFQSLGTYSVLLVVTDTTTCNRIDSIKSVLNVIPPTFFDLGEDAFLCPNDNLLLKSNVTAISYSWSTGQTSPNINISAPGTYSLTITNNGGCKSGDEIIVLRGEDNLVRFPNVITPNDDNINDLIDFKKFRLEEMEFILFDRWGTEHYRITDVNSFLKPNELKDGTYYYVVSYKSNCAGKHNTAKGFISIFK